MNKYPGYKLASSTIIDFFKFALDWEANQKSCVDFSTQFINLNLPNTYIRTMVFKGTVTNDLSYLSFKYFAPKNSDNY
jgi:hypothetical protein